MAFVRCVTINDIDIASIECEPEFCSAALINGAYIIVDEDMNAFIMYDEDDMVRVRVDEAVISLFCKMFE